MLHIQFIRTARNIVAWDNEFFRTWDSLAVAALPPVESGNLRPFIPQHGKIRFAGIELSIAMDMVSFLTGCAAAQTKKVLNTDSIGDEIEIVARRISEFFSIYIS
ncbi:hypothetical protein [Paracoccus alkanivorans]|uniref:Uncharacterized protein n=1 Tax=Paracoccus alkanivorans TaxID=2116655 RepID=A0A3M0MBQ5_9RHOB|nr:hypothetical protein [Paracoccus alkanivorans]RMC33714.1 hypothetical protein C9E81_15515 [Paracoccus alkanivorans]